MTKERKPIIYLKDQDIRFGEMDAYGHLNAKHYLDLVASARLIFLERDLKYPIEKIMSQGVGFYLKKATQNFRRPIVGLQRVWVRSFVSQLSEASLIVDFEILDADQAKAYATGQLEYVVVDLKTQRPVPPPDWLLDVFFTKE